MSLLHILHQPIDVDARDAQERTPLMLAAVAGDTLFVGILLHHGANSNAQDIHGFSPLQCAAIDGNIDCIQKLAEKNADLVAKDEIGRTPEDIALERGQLHAWNSALKGMHPGRVRSFKYQDALSLICFAFVYLVYV